MHTIAAAADTHAAALACRGCGNALADHGSGAGRRYAACPRCGTAHQIIAPPRHEPRLLDADTLPPARPDAGTTPAMI